MKSSLTRREFLKNAGALAAASAFPAVIPGSALGRDGRPAPSERITMGFIGLGGQGDRDMRALMAYPEVQVVALCDVDLGSDKYERHWVRGLAPAREAVESHYAEEKRSGKFQGIQCTQDFREILSRSDIDAVGIATPDHWHGLMVVAAARAGKDIYCQKPLSLTIDQGRAMVEAVRRYGRVFQCGTQRRSEERCRRACELVRNGRIGDLKTIRVGLPGGHSQVREDVGWDPMPVPSELDYDLWLGPAPWAPYTLQRCHFTFRWNLDYSGGQVTDWGAHFCDMAHWGMGTDRTGPVSVEGEGKFPKDHPLWQTATNFRFVCEYAEGFTMNVANTLNTGVRFEGTKGWLTLDLESDIPGIQNEVVGPEEFRLYESHSQYENFVQCVRTRAETSAPVEVAHRSVSVAHLGNIAMRLGRKLVWDPVLERFPHDEEANKLLSRPMRSPWTL